MKTLEANGIRLAYVTGEPGNGQVKDDVWAGHTTFCFSHLSVKAIKMDEVHCIKKWYMKNHVPSMLAKGVETINRQTQQTSSHNGLWNSLKLGHNKLLDCNSVWYVHVLYYIYRQT